MIKILHLVKNKTKSANQIYLRAKQLENLCRSRVYDQGVAPWVNWSTELYSYGKCLREIAQFPKIFPIFAASDHGVNYDLFFDKYAIDSQLPLYFTSNQLRQKRLQSLTKSKVIYIQHPMVQWRKIFTTKSSELGSLIFFPHSNHHSLPVSVPDFISEVNKIDSNYMPFTIMLHMHDVIAGAHIELLNLGFNVVTAGNTSSTKFAQRFYELLESHKYVFSFGLGSQVFYSLEAGKKLILLPLLNQKTTTDGLFGAGYFSDMPLDSESRPEFKKFCSNLMNSSSSNQNEIKNFVASKLGLDSKYTTDELRHDLYSAMKQSRRKIIYLYSGAISQSIRKF